VPENKTRKTGGAVPAFPIMEMDDRPPIRDGGVLSATTIDRVWWKLNEGRVMEARSPGFVSMV
jgi:hypothetical protein